MTPTMIGIDDIWDRDVDATKLINYRRSSVKINAGIVIEFDTIEVFESVNRLVDTIKAGVSELIEFTVHGEWDIEIARGVQNEDFMFFGIEDHDEINVGARSKRQSVVAVVDAADIDRERRVERVIFGDLNWFWRNSKFNILQNMEFSIDFLIVFFERLKVGPANQHGF